MRGSTKLALLSLPLRLRPDNLSGMKIATFNINNINRRLPNLLRWLRSAEPDIVSLQELKSTDADFPVAAIAKDGPAPFGRGKKNREGRRHPGAQSRAGADPDRVARRSRRPRGALYRSRR